ncbi:MAG: urea carboxylase-associated family protein [Vulcanimicrobiaceae bacterium]
MQRIAPQSGVAFTMHAGETLTVIDIEGEQVADLFAFARDDRSEALSSGRSLDYAETIFLTRGATLYSNRSRPMFSIVDDTVGRHDFLLTPCSQETFEIIYGVRDPHPSCFGNLRDAFAAYDIAPEAITTTFNIFMNVEIAADGALTVAPPLSRAGDRIVLRAEMELIVGLTACSAEMSNNYSFKPIAWRVDPPSAPASITPSS